MSKTQHDAKRTMIIDVAFKVFGDLGYQTTTIKAIAESAGIAPGSIYTYFADKEDLFRTAVSEGWAQFLSQFQGLVGSAKPLDARLHELIEMGFEKLKESLPLLRGMLFEASQMESFHANLEQFCSYVERLLEEERQSATLDIGDDDTWRKFLRITVNGILFTVSLTPPEATDAEIASLKRAVWSMLRDRFRGGEKP